MLSIDTNFINQYLQDNHAKYGLTHVIMRKENFVGVKGLFVGEFMSMGGFNVVMDGLTYWVERGNTCVFNSIASDTMSNPASNFVFVGYKLDLDQFTEVTETPEQIAYNQGYKDFITLYHSTGDFEQYNVNPVPYPEYTPEQNTAYNNGFYTWQSYAFDIVDKMQEGSLVEDGLFRYILMQNKYAGQHHIIDIYKRQGVNFAVFSVEYLAQFKYRYREYQLFYDFGAILFGIHTLDGVPYVPEPLNMFTNSIISEDLWGRFIDGCMSVAGGSMFRSYTQYLTANGR